MQEIIQGMGPFFLNLGQYTKSERLLSWESFILFPEKAMATHSSTLAWKIPWMEEPEGCSPWGHEESDTTERLHFHFSLSCIGEGNGNPLQCSCLKNPRGSGAWWAAVYGVTQSWTRLKQLSSSILFPEKQNMSHHPQDWYT